MTCRIQQPTYELSKSTARVLEAAKAGRNPGNYQCKPILSGRSLPSAQGQASAVKSSRVAGGGFGALESTEKGQISCELLRVFMPQATYENKWLIE